MKKILLIAALCVMPFAAQAEERIVDLPGNAQYRTGGGNSNVIIRHYDNDEILYRRLINPRYGRDYNRRIPTNDAASVCGGIERDRKRARCVEDYYEERQKLIKKYN